MEELKNLLTCGSPWAEERARIAIELQEMFANGDISVHERNELLRDLVNTDTLNEEADDINVKSALIAAVSGAMSLV
tara:strand:- start:843 stop:1073 length:231 start_codon:yes stop_codon:yes gene_type:complete